MASIFFSTNIISWTLGKYSQTPHLHQRQHAREAPHQPLLQEAGPLPHGVAWGVVALGVLKRQQHVLQHLRYAMCDVIWACVTCMTRAPRQHKRTDTVVSFNCQTTRPLRAQVGADTTIPQHCSTSGKTTREQTWPEAKGAISGEWSFASRKEQRPFALTCE